MALTSRIELRFLLIKLSNLKALTINMHQCKSQIVHIKSRKELITTKNNKHLN